MKNLSVFFMIVVAPFIVLCPPTFSETKTIITDAKAHIGAVLELTVSQKGQSELKFGNIRPSAIHTTEVGPVVMQIEVKSNTGERYQVTQTMNSALENAEGSKMAAEHLKFKTASSKSNGAVVSEPTPVTAAAQVIFTSDTQGSSDTISVEYTLTVPPSQAPGDYSALLTYTVSSL